MIGKWVPKRVGGWDPWVEKLTREGAIVSVDEEMEADAAPVEWKGIAVQIEEGEAKLVKWYYVSRAMYDELLRRYGRPIGEGEGELKDETGKKARA